MTIEQPEVPDSREDAATVDELRAALYDAQRALMHAERRLPIGQVRGLVREALATVSATLDKGRDERNEQVAT